MPCFASKRFRPDLTVSPFSDDSEDNPRLVIQDPAAGSLFELGEQEVFLCRQLDGRRDCAAIREAFRERFDIAIDDGDLRAFYAQMEAYGLLEPTPAGALAEETAAAAPTAPEPPRKPPRSRRADPYRWRFFNPDRLFLRFAKLLRPLRYVVWLLIPGVPLALLSLFHHQPAYRLTMGAIGQLRGAGILGALLMVLVGLFLVNLLSKWMQGTVCAYYGVPVRDFGFRLAFGVIPRFWINKRSIWGLPREQRLWTFGSALLVKLALFVLGTLVWQWSYRGVSGLGTYALLLGHMGLGAFLFTANPLWQADGYAWFISYFEIPHLREKAFKLLGMRLKGRKPPAALSDAERRGLMAYALASLSFVAFVVGSVLIFIALMLEARYSGAGVVLFLAVLALVSHWILGRLRRKGQGRGGSAAEGPPADRAEPMHPPASPAPPPPAAEFGPEASSPPPARQRKRWLWLLFFGLLIALGLLPYPYEISGGVTLHPVQQAEVRARASGEVTAVLVREGEWVNQGQPLARLSDWEQRHAIALIEADLEKNRAELALLLSGARAESILTTQRELDLARVKARHAKKQLDLLTPGYQQGTLSALEYQKSVLDAEVSAAAVAVAEADLAQVQAAPREEEAAILRAELRRLQEQLDYQQSELARTQIIAPMAGRVTSARVDRKLGQFVREGDLILQLQDDRAIEAEILTPETDVADTGLGRAVEIKLWAHPTRVFRGEVTSIAPTVEEDPDSPFVRVVRVGSRLSNADSLLRTQMTGYAKIDGGEKPLAVAFTRMLVRFFTIEVWSWLP